jgi:hypothetical protein
VSVRPKDVVAVAVWDSVFVVICSEPRVVKDEFILNVKPNVNCLCILCWMSTTVIR